MPATSTVQAFSDRELDHHCIKFSRSRHHLASTGYSSVSVEGHTASPCKQIYADLGHSLQVGHGEDHISPADVDCVWPINLPAAAAGVPREQLLQGCLATARLTHTGPNQSAEMFRWRKGSRCSLQKKTINEPTRLMSITSNLQARVLRPDYGCGKRWMHTTLGVVIQLFWLVSTPGGS